MNTLKLHPEDDSPVIVIESPLVRVGRDEGSDICLPDGSVSRHHAEIEYRGDEWFIFDLNSSNGIRINGIQVPNARLQSGQLLQIGRVDFRVEVDTPGDNATMVLDRSPVFDEGPGATMIAPPRPQAAPRAMPRGAQREAPRSKSSDAMGAVTAVVVSVALVLGAIEIYNTWGKPVEPAFEPPPAELAAEPPTAVEPPAPAPAKEDRAATMATAPAPAPGKGALLVSTDLPATVSIDGQKGVRLEASGLKSFEVTPGDHVVRFRADGWHAEVVAKVKAGEQKLVKPEDDADFAKR